MSPWTTRQTFRLGPPYVSEDPDFDLRDGKFYKMANHFILHHQDAYILQQNSLRLRTYMEEQRAFWKDTEACTGLLGYKFGLYARDLPDYWHLGSRTRQVAEEVDTLFTEMFRLTESVMRYEKWFGRYRSRPPVHVVNRLLEEVKLPPPFIPTITRRFSFG